MTLIIDNTSVYDCEFSANAIVVDKYINVMNDHTGTHDVLVKDGNDTKMHCEKAIMLANTCIDEKYYLCFREKTKQEEDAKVYEFLINNQSSAADILPSWVSGVTYSVGTCISYNNLIYRVLQAHTSQSDWTPDKTPALFARIDGRSNDADYPDWVQPTGATDAYAKDDKVTYGGKRWVSDLNDNVWVPGVYGWTLASEVKNSTDKTDTDSGDTKNNTDTGTIAEWVQPTGSTDAYAKDTKVTHNGKTWMSTVDANTWEPGVYGWTEVTTE